MCPSPRSQPLRGFTLIELLIVVAIIAILAAIAVPNFLEAQTRSKVSRMQADMRTIATALEAYQVDYNRYPLDTLQRAIAGVTPFEYSTQEIFIPLTTPVAYLTSLEATADIFQEQEPYSPNLPGTFGYVLFINYWPPSLPGVSNNGLTAEREGIRMNWVLGSFGPDGESSAINIGRPINNFPVTGAYDPTNGTISEGDIRRSS